MHNSGNGDNLTQGKVQSQIARYNPLGWNKRDCVEGHQHIVNFWRWCPKNGLREPTWWCWALKCAQECAWSGAGFNRIKTRHSFQKLTSFSSPQQNVCSLQRGAGATESFTKLNLKWGPESSSLDRKIASTVQSSLSHFASFIWENTTNGQISNLIVV